MGDYRACAGKAKAVHRRIRVADEAQSFIERCLTALVDGLAEQQNRTAIARGLCPQLRDGQCYPIQNGCPLITFVQACKLLGGIGCSWRKRHEQMRHTVETNDGDSVFYVADQHVEDRV